MYIVCTESPQSHCQRVCANQHTATWTWLPYLNAFPWYVFWQFVQDKEEPYVSCIIFYLLFPSSRVKNWRSRPLTLRTGIGWGQQARSLRPGWLMAVEFLSRWNALCISLPCQVLASKVQMTQGKQVLFPADQILYRHTDTNACVCTCLQLQRSRSTWLYKTRNQHCVLRKGVVESIAASSGVFFTASELGKLNTINFYTN